MPDVSKIAIGDMMHVRHVYRGINYKGHLILKPTTLADIVHVEPRPLQVGDRVTWGAKVNNYTIRFIDDDDVALLRPEEHGLDPRVMSVSDLVRADA